MSLGPKVEERKRKGGSQKIQLLKEEPGRGKIRRREQNRLVGHRQMQHIFAEFPKPVSQLILE